MTESNIFCPYCGETVNVYQASHGSGAWDSIIGECPECGYIEMDLECYGKCVEEILPDELLSSNDNGTKTDGKDYDGS